MKQEDKNNNTQKTVLGYNLIPKSINTFTAIINNRTIYTNARQTYLFFYKKNAAESKQCNQKIQI